MSLGHSRLIPTISVIGDIIILNTLFSIGYIYTSAHTDLTITHYLFFAFLNLTWLGLSFVFGVFNFERHTSKIKLFSTTFQTTVFFLVAFLTYFQWNPDLLYYTKEQKQILFPIFFVSLLLWKFILYFSFLLYRSKGYNYRNVLIIGESTSSNKLQSFFKENIWHGYRCHGILSITEENERTIGTIDDLDKLIKRHHIDELYIAMECMPIIKQRNLLSHIQNRPVEIRIIPDLSDFSFLSTETVEYGNVPIMVLHPGPLSHTGNKFLKRSLDILFSLCVIIGILSWIIPILWLIDLAGNRNGVFFIQKRTSIYGKQFHIIKFRTMIPNKDADFQQAIQGDQRITPLGSFMRKTSIDELPQFINVLKGDMSVVGPRPHMLAHTEEYQKIIKTFMQRHIVKPGITGLAQVSGYRGEIRTSHDIANRVELDIEYIRQWSIFLDIQIIWKTIWLSFKRS
jgi:Undecaprenyl-phosphate glucose phosphotransferase